MPSTSIPQIAGQRLLKAFSFTKRPCEQVEYADQTIMPTATQESAPKQLKEIDAEAEAQQGGLVACWELLQIKKKRRGSLSYNNNYVQGLHTVACLVACGNCHDPLLSCVWPDGPRFCPQRYCIVRFKVYDIIEYFKGLPEENEAEAADEAAAANKAAAEDEAAAATKAAAEDEAAANTEAAAEDESAALAVAMKCHTYLIHEMEIFQSTMAERKLSVGETMRYLKATLPTTFLKRSEISTFKKFPEKIANIRARAEKKAAHQKAVADRKKARQRVAPTMAEKEADMVEVFAPAAGGRGGHSHYPSSLHVAIAIMLYAQFQIGVPLTAALALPLITGLIKKFSALRAHRQPLHFCRGQHRCGVAHNPSHTARAVFRAARANFHYRIEYMHRPGS